MASVVIAQSRKMWGLALETFSSDDAIVSGLFLNFLPDPANVLREMKQLVRPPGVLAAYVWDYAGEMQPMRRFWDAAIPLDASAANLDAGQRASTICRPERLTPKDQIDEACVDWRSKWFGSERS